MPSVSPLAAAPRARRAPVAPVAAVALVLAPPALAACSHAYVAIGYDARRQASGVMDTTVVDRANTGSVGLGVGTRFAGIEARFQSHDLDPSLTGARFASASTSLELRLAPIHVGPVSLYCHGGPDRGAVFDKQMMDLTWGIGFRAGAGAEVAYHGIGVWVDAAREELSFGGDVVNGRGDRDVVQVGIRIGQ